MTNFFPRRHLLPLLLAGVTIAGGCKSKTEPQPDPAPLATTEPFDTESDVFSRSHGYWEWINSTLLIGQITPTSVGFTRQLVFKGDSIVYIFHNQKLEMQPTYHLHAGPTRCSQPNRPLVDFNAEPKLLNSYVRTYDITRTAADTTLRIMGEAICLDAGAIERYKWHRRR